MRSTLRAPVALLALLILGAASAPAQQGTESDALVITAENRTAAAEAARGAARPDDAVRGGDVLRYTLTFTNPTDGSVRGVVLHNPVPEGLVFVAGSARADRADARIEYSIDGGASFSAEPMIETTEAGGAVRRPAPPELYTDVRWVVEGMVEPGARVVASYEARMPADAVNTTAGPSGSGSDG